MNSWIFLLEISNLSLSSKRMTGVWERCEEGGRKQGPGRRSTGTSTQYYIATEMKRRQRQG